MCGICGIIFVNQQAESEIIPIISAMTSSLRHRGPNDLNIWKNYNNSIFLGHTRLAILDLTDAGSQPMLSESKHLVITFNGEIYNHFAIRSKLSHTNWKGTSDTETILYSIEEKGINWFLENASGMFSLAIFNQKTKTLTLVNDRFGEKPLYYSLNNKFLIFGSELKCLKANKKLVTRINKKALALYTRYGYIPAPYSIYENIYKIKPGNIIEFKIKNSGIEILRNTSYWDANKTVESNLQEKFIGSFSSAVKKTETLLLQSVKDRMLSDVSIGAFLSGGIDSSLIVSLMQKNSTEKIRTFTMGFDEEGYNESFYAKSIADHLKTDHTELLVTPSLALDVIPDLPIIYDEPFSDSSQIPTYILCKLTSNHVTVALSGDAGDELFGGYNRHISTYRIWQRIKRFPLPLRLKISSLIMKISPSLYGKFYANINKVLFMLENIEHFPDKIQKFAKILRCNSLDEVYQALVSIWDDSNEVLIESNNLNSIIDFTEIAPKLDCYEHSIMLLDTISYLPGDILTKIDRAAMSVSLETRLPFLDRDVFNFAWRLPIEFKINDGKGKYILREILSKHVPSELWNRPKKGFSVPLEHWLRGPLKEWAYELIKKEKIIEQGYFNYDEVAKKWNEHQTCSHNWQDYLWNILIFQAWIENQI